MDVAVKGRNTSRSRRRWSGTRPEKVERITRFFDRRAQRLAGVGRVDPRANSSNPEPEVADATFFINARFSRPGWPRRTCTLLST